MAEKIATRVAYGQALAELAEKYPRLVVLDADLSSATMTKYMASAYPERFFDCGIAEGCLLCFGDRCVSGSACPVEQQCQLDCHGLPGAWH